MSEVFFSLFELYTNIYLYQINSEKKRDKPQLPNSLFFSHTDGIVRGTRLKLITKL